MNLFPIFAFCMEPNACDEKARECWCCSFL